MANSDWAGASFRGRSVDVGPGSSIRSRLVRLYLALSGCSGPELPRVAVAALEDFDEEFPGLRSIEVEFPQPFSYYDGAQTAVFRAVGLSLRPGKYAAIYDDEGRDQANYLVEVAGYAEDPDGKVPVVVVARKKWDKYRYDYGLAKSSRGVVVSLWHPGMLRCLSRGDMPRIYLDDPGSYSIPEWMLPSVLMVAGPWGSRPRILMEV